MFDGNPDELRNILTVVVPGIEKLARELQPDESFKILKEGQEGKLELTKRQIAQILANAFFCNFKDIQNLSHINFDKYYNKYLNFFLSCKITTISANYTVFQVIRYARK